VLLAAGGLGTANAGWERETIREASGAINRPGKARLAVVALREQRVTFYDRDGRMARAPVSSGAADLETPAGEAAIGSYVFTDARAQRWRCALERRLHVSARPRGAASIGARQRVAVGGKSAKADVEGAVAALDRIEIPRRGLDRLTELALPGSSLIVSDEGPSIETDKDTDFVVLMSNEPQGGIKTRHRNPSNYWVNEFGRARPRASFFSSFSALGRRS
jgi:hypothetical protein